MSSNSDDENKFEDQDYFDNVLQSESINKSNHNTHQINEDDSETDDPIGEIENSHSVHSESSVHEFQDASNFQARDAENDHRQDDQEIETVGVVPKRYNTRGSKAKPSTNQSENERNQSSKSSKYGAYPAFVAQYKAGTELTNNSNSYEEAMSRPEADKWYAERLSDISPGSRPLSGKLVFKTKRDQNGDILKYKVRWVVRGFEQKEGIDYNQTFASTCHSTTWKLAISIAIKYGYDIHQLDVIAAFLQGDVEGEVYVEMPPKWKEILNLDADGDVCRLSQSLYGLKQSPRLWQKKLRKVLRKLNYSPLPSDEAAYINTSTEDFSLIITHVDDSLVISKSDKQLRDFKRDTAKELDIEDLGFAHYFLGVRIVRKDDAIYLCQDARWK